MLAQIFLLRFVKKLLFRDKNYSNTCNVSRRKVNDFLVMNNVLQPPNPGSSIGKPVNPHVWTQTSLQISEALDAKKNPRHTWEKFSKLFKSSSVETTHLRINKTNSIGKDEIWVCVEGFACSQREVPKNQYLIII